MPTIEKGKQPMTATEEELDYEIRLSPEVHCFGVHLVLARVMGPNCPSVLSANTDHVYQGQLVRTEPKRIADAYEISGFSNVLSTRLSIAFMFMSVQVQRATEY